MGENTSLTKIECQCNHFSSFASKIFVKPNPIDLDAVLAGFSVIADNLSVLMMLGGIVGIYVVAVIILRRSDKQDQRKVSTLHFEHILNKHIHLCG